MVWFLASFDLGPDVRIGYCRPDDSGQPTANSVTVADGSWAEVTLADEDGAHDGPGVGDAAVAWRMRTQSAT